jgi:hypothetical protein
MSPLVPAVSGQDPERVECDHPSGGALAGAVFEITDCDFKEGNGCKVASARICGGS